jgi:hypothetical protein
MVSLEGPRKAQLTNVLGTDVYMMEPPTNSSYDSEVVRVGERALNK